MPDFARSADPAVQAELSHLELLSPGADVLGLERITRLLDALGNPHRAMPPVFHVAGTNGKGSTCAFLRAALEEAGHRVHVFTSPHLVRFNERIRIAGKLVEDSELAGLLREVREVSADIRPSFFEATTAAAFLAFARHPAEACIIEVGLGGRLDATNVIERPLVCGIASLGLDHRQFLGDTIGQIATEKAGIAKAGVPMVTMEYEPEAEAAIEKALEAAGSTRIREGRDWHVEKSGEGFVLVDPSGSIDLPSPSLVGPHQMRNAGLALAMLRRQSQLTVCEDAMQRGVASARWPARMQRLLDGPITERLPSGMSAIVDGAHNRDAAEALAAALGGDDDLVVITGILRNRTVQDVLGAIAPRIAQLYAVPLRGHDDIDPKDICAQAMALLDVLWAQPCGSIDEALAHLARDISRFDPRPRRLLITGSLYLAGEALELNGEVPD